MDIMGGASKRLVDVGDVLEGRYRISKILGEGGMGTVYLAEHALIKRKVAIKILHSQFASDAAVIERFMNEARAAGTLGHPNIVESHDMGFTHGHVPYIVFEYLEGSLLTDEVYRVGGLPMRRAVRIAEQIADALRAAHDAGIVHRDLKSDNIFLTDKDDESDRVKVLDFGISRFMHADDVQRGLIMGTPEFMAPEQFTHPEGIDRRVDIYALGVILYEMLTARRPFAVGKDSAELQRRIITEPPPPIDREIPRALHELIVDKMLAKEPSARPQTMGAVGAALEAFLTRSDGTPIPRRRSQPISVPQSPDTNEIPRPLASRDTPFPIAAVSAPPAKRPYIVYAIAGASVALGAVGVLFGMSGRSEPTQYPTIAPATTTAQPAPAKPEVAKVDVEVVADVDEAHVLFRRRVAQIPMKVTISPSDIVELVEVTAPGYKTERYWLTFDRPTHLKAHLVKGEGLDEASEEQTLIALGELAAPAPAAASAAAAKASASSSSAKTVDSSSGEPHVVMARRKIGRAAAPAAEEALVEPVETTVAMEKAAPKRQVVAAPAVGIETAAMPKAPNVADVQAPPTPVEDPKPTWVDDKSAPSAPVVAPKPAATVAAAEPPHTIKPAQLAAMLAQGTPIAPSDLVQQEMMRQEKPKVSAVVKVCVSETGAVTSSSIAKSSGFAEYDDKLVANVRTYKYRPYQFQGRNVPVCSAVAFQFKIQ